MEVGFFPKTDWYKSEVKKGKQEGTCPKWTTFGNTECYIIFILEMYTELYNKIL